MALSEPVCQLEDIPDGGSIGLNSNGEELFAVRKGDQLYLYRNNCPHDHIPLNWEPDQFMDTSGTLIECANHGALFTIETGECVAGPCLGDCLEAVDFTLTDGKAYLNP
ncbi:Rieske 2Fe-2S domain-containing protein [Marinimicrobium sp. ABcell2]|uniref:Rieske (2Fe-2S) protein n=1 Tax=Marinimicrobium sp. ABcell2 TaxID=3069751 RepID=UPI0027ADD1F6|nr:Rieske 2Fe-2S domain-containing protein [Marinimicrobium sp. ABcell2]MDQ2077680.1 Rieske 2Fe-2S domain-containing protein [Marinimicrobium sp. ABcell2]